MAARFQQQIRLLPATSDVLDEIGQELAKQDPTFINYDGGSNRAGKVNHSKVIRYLMAKADPRLAHEADFDGRL